MKQNYEKPFCKFVPLDITGLEEEFKNLSEEEIKVKLIEREYQSKKYKANTNFVLREIGGSHVLVSVGSQIADFCGIVNLNKAAVVLWNSLQSFVSKEDMVQVLKDTFSVSKEKANEDVEKTIQLLMDKGMITCE